MDAENKNSGGYQIDNKIWAKVMKVLKIHPKNKSEDWVIRMTFVNIFHTLILVILSFILCKHLK